MKNSFLKNAITRLLPALLLALNVILATSAAAQVDDNPALVSLPQPGFETDTRALVVIFHFIDADTVEFLGAVLSETPPGASFAAPPQLEVAALDGEGKALVVQKAPYPQWVFTEDENGNESKTEMDGEVAYFGLPFDPAMREVRINDLVAQVPVATADLTPSLVKFCVDGDITDVNYCQQFPCFNNPSLPGCADNSDACPSDPFKTEAGICGCGTADTDGDLDGTADCQDSCPADAAKIEPQTCGCDIAEVDADGDGVPDCTDQCPADPVKDVPGSCGCGVADSDVDTDLVPDCIDNCPAVSNSSQADQDGDGVGDACQTVDPKAGDLNGDGQINDQDYQVLRLSLGSCEGDARFNSEADYNGDGCVNYPDLREWQILAPEAQPEPTQPPGC